MTKQQQQQIIQTFTTERHNVIKKKQEDYAQGTDVLSNFRFVSQANGRTPAHVILDEVHKKVLRLQNLMQGKTPNNESITDSVLDLANYSDLLYCAMMEGKTVQAPKEATFTDKAVIVRAIIKEIKRIGYGEGTNNLSDGSTLNITNTSHDVKVQTEDVYFSHLHDRVFAMSASAEDLAKLFDQLSTTQAVTTDDCEKELVKLLRDICFPDSKGQKYGMYDVSRTYRDEDESFVYMIAKRDSGLKPMIVVSKSEYTSVKHGDINIKKVIACLK